jgi:hypothetical protein
VPDGRDGRGEDQGGAGSAEEADGEEELPECCDGLAGRIWYLGKLKLAFANAHKKNTSNETDASSNEKHPWAFDIKDRANLKASEEGDEDIEAEDPAYGTVAACSQLVFG